MKANNTTIESGLRLAFSPEYVNALSLVELAETWSDNHNTRDLGLNIAAYAEQCTYKMEQEGATLELDAWERLTAEIERIARVWVSLYCNEISWSNRPEWIANSVRAAINTTTTPETPNPDNNTPSTMNANDIRESISRLRYELQQYHNNASKGCSERRRNMILLRWDIRRLERRLKAIEATPHTKSMNGKSAKDLQRQMTRISGPRFDKALEIYGRYLHNIAVYFSGDKYPLAPAMTPDQLEIKVPQSIYTAI